MAISLVEKFKDLTPIYKFGVFLLFLETCFTLYWFATMIFLIVNSDETHRVFQGFLAVHMLIASTAIFYVIEARNKTPYIFPIWAFISLLFYDLYALIDSITHLIRTPEIPYNIVFAGSIWITAMSTMTLIWYFVIICLPKENKEIGLPLLKINKKSGLR
jgi:hypothetical protein